MLELDDVNRTFGGVRALDGVSLTVEEGDVHGLIGPNGAGKTTLINVLSGHLPPTAGRVRYRGEEIQALPAHRMAALGVARTFQNIRLFPLMSCLENVLAGQHLVANRSLLQRLLFLPAAGREERELREKATTTLERVGLTERAGVLAQNLSYGERRRLEIARALAASPKLLLLDEPVAGMRPGELEEVAALIRTLPEQGVTVLLIEHNMAFVMDLCSRITVLNFGRVVTTGAPEEVRNHPEVVEAYLGTEEHA